MDNCVGTLEKLDILSLFQLSHFSTPSLNETRREENYALILSYDSLLQNPPSPTNHFLESHETLLTDSKRRQNQPNSKLYFQQERKTLQVIEGREEEERKGLKVDRQAEEKDIEDSEGINSDNGNILPIKLVNQEEEEEDEIEKFLKEKEKEKKKKKVAIPNFEKINKIPSTTQEIKNQATQSKESTFLNFYDFLSFNSSNSTPPNSTPSNSTPPNYTPPNYTPPNSTPPNSTPPNSTPPNYTPPNSTPPNSTPPNSTPPNYTPPNYTPPSNWNNKNSSSSLKPHSTSSLYSLPRSNLLPLSSSPSQPSLQHFHNDSSPNFYNNSSPNVCTFESSPNFYNQLREPVYGERNLMEYMKRLEVESSSLRGNTDASGKGMNGKEVMAGERKSFSNIEEVQRKSQLPMEELIIHNKLLQKGHISQLKKRLSLISLFSFLLKEGILCSVENSPNSHFSSHSFNSLSFSPDSHHFYYFAHLNLHNSQLLQSYVTPPPFPSFFPYSLSLQ